MIKRDIICIGASAGGLEAVRDIISKWESPIPAAVFVVIHSPSDAFSALPHILARADTLPAVHPSSGDEIEHGCIYAAPPDHHLIIQDSRVILSSGPKENLVRPAIDPLFRSAAEAYGPRVVGVVLSGTLDDGTAGLMTIKRHGGVTIAQEPAEAAFPGMPESAIENSAADIILPVAGIADELWALANTPVDESGIVAMMESSERDIIDKEINAQIEGKREGVPSTLACPDCGGVLWELRDGDMIRYRCHTGHLLSMDSLAQGISEKTEDALWNAVRVLQEKAMLHRRMANMPSRKRHPDLIAESERQADEADKEANILLEMLKKIPETKDR